MSAAWTGPAHPELPWYVSWFTAMFMHGSWSQILGNMLFLAIFGKNVEDAFGHLRYLLMYIAGGFAATALQTIMTLTAGTAADAQAPMLGASGAVAAVLGAYWVLYPDARISARVLVFIVRVRASVFLGLWFVYQFVAANLGMFSAGDEDGGTAFFAHVGGFVFGVIVATAMARSGQRQDRRALERRQWRAGGECRQPASRDAGNRASGRPGLAGGYLGGSGASARRAQRSGSTSTSRRVMRLPSSCSTRSRAPFT